MYKNNIYTSELLANLVSSFIGISGFFSVLFTCLCIDLFIQLDSNNFINYITK